eukprot:2371881-Lingulodinium_polyedra.AAC.1
MFLWWKKPIRIRFARARSRDRPSELRRGLPKERPPAAARGRQYDAPRGPPRVPPGVVRPPQ